MRSIIFDPDDGSWYAEHGWETDREKAKVFSSKRAAFAVINGGWCSKEMAASLRVLPFTRATVEQRTEEKT